MKTKKGNEIDLGKILITIRDGEDEDETEKSNQELEKLKGNIDKYFKALTKLLKSKNNEVKK
jgi:hypothetical protein